MRLRHLWIGSLAGLAGLTGVAFANVSTDPSDGPSTFMDYGTSGLYGLGPLTLRPITPERLGVTARLPDRTDRRVERTPVVQIRYEQDFLDALPRATGDAQWECLAQAIYFEARGETIKGQFAVGEVILNRVKSPLYPKTICRVVHQGGSGGCQFSFTCDGMADRIREKDAYRTAGKIARLMLDGAPRILTDGATHFHTRSTRPRWAHRMPQTASIGQHKFYRVAGSR